MKRDREREREREREENIYTYIQHCRKAFSKMWARGFGEKSY